MIRRREFIAGLGVAAWPLVARGQQPMMPVIGFLSTATRTNARFAPFHQSLKEAGFVEGQNLTIEYRSAEGHYDRLPALAADLVRRRVTVIVTSGTPHAIAAKAATATIPIVFGIGDAAAFCMGQGR